MRGSSGSWRLESVSEVQVVDIEPLWYSERTWGMISGILEGCGR